MRHEGCSAQELGFPIALCAGETETEVFIALSLGFPIDELLLVDTNPAVLAVTAAASHQVGGARSGQLSSPLDGLVLFTQPPLPPQLRPGRVASTPPRALSPQLSRV